MRRGILFLLLLLVVTSSFFICFCVQAANNSLLIYQVQLSGQTSQDEYVILYNGNNQDIVLQDYQLVKKTKSGTASYVVSDFKDKVILAHRYFLVASKEYAGAILPDFYYTNSSASLADDNAVILQNKDKQITDLVGFGSSVDFEGAALPNIKNNFCVYRPNQQDSDNNVQDFILQENCQIKNSQDQIIGEVTPAPSELQATIEAPETAFVKEIIDFSASKSGAVFPLATDFFWSFGDEKTGQGEKISHIYENPGVYQVELTVSDENGLTATTAREITVKEREKSLTLNEVAFSLEHDFLEIKILQTGIYDSYEIYEGNKLLAKIPAWGQMAVGDYLVLENDSGLTTDQRRQDNNPDVWEIFMDKNLTATDSYLLIKNRDGEIVDAVLWANNDGRFTKNTDFLEEIFLQKQWPVFASDSTDQAAGINSSTSQNMASFCRLENAPDTDTSADWFLTKVLTPGFPNILSDTQETDTAKPIVSSVLSPEPSIKTKDIILNEIFVNGEQEWVELYNDSGFDLSLDQLVLEDGGEHKVLLAGFLPKKGYRVFAAKNFLNNDGDVLFLKILSTKQIIDQVTYGAWQDGNLADNAPLPGPAQSLALKYPPIKTNVDSQDYGLTENLTPEKGNIIFLSARNNDSDKKPMETTLKPDIAAKNALSPEKQPQAPSKKSLGTVKTPVVAKQSYLKVSLEQVSQYKENTKLEAEGVVMVLPGIFGKQIMYLQDNDKGLQVYCYKSDFGDLAMGDKVRVQGEVSITNSGKRLRITDSSDIQILQKDLLITSWPAILTALDTKFLDNLVQVEGEITEIKNNYFFIDDGTAEIKALIKENTGINLDNLNLGQKVKVVGILAKEKENFIVWPRQSDDILVQLIEEPLSEQKNMVLTTVSQRDSGIAWYFGGFFAFSLAFFLWILVKKKMRGI